MGQTIGKRIMHHRKRMGMTQDQLAEKLGVTAQAVSKWENDQSCPDISILVTLAEIFGITTDALLGRTDHTSVHQAELVTDAELSEDDDTHTSKGGWSFEYNISKHWPLCFAVWVLAVGIQLFAGSLFQWELSVWGTLWTTALTVFGLFSLIHKFSFFSVGSFLFGAYFMLENLHFHLFSVNKTMLFPAVLIVFGVSLLIDALKKPKKASFQFHNTGHSEKTKNQYRMDDECLEYTASFGENRQDVCADKLSKGRITTSFGDYEVDLTGVKEVSDDCHLQINCSFGDLTLILPGRFAVKQNNSTSFGEVSVSGQPDAQPQGVIHMQCNASFGEISIEYV